MRKIIQKRLYISNKGKSLGSSLFLSRKNYTPYNERNDKLRRSKCIFRPTEGPEKGLRKYEMRPKVNRVLSPFIFFKSKGGIEMIVGQGEMEKTKHGALRESNEGRGRFDLLPYEAIEALAKWYEEGAKKYDERNWENGISVKDCINRMIRHSLKAGNGWTDEDHLAAVMWNAAAAITMMQRRPDCNDHRWHVHKKDPSETITGVKSGKLHFDEELWCIDPSKIGPGQIMTVKDPSDLRR